MSGSFIAEEINIDDASDWRKAEWQLYVTGLRDAITGGTLPAWLTFASVDGWYGVQIHVDGQPMGPPLTWPNALFVAEWLKRGRERP